MSRRPRARSLASIACRCGGSSGKRAARGCSPVPEGRTWIGLRLSALSLPPVANSELLWLLLSDWTCCSWCRAVGFSAPAVKERMWPLGLGCGDSLDL